VTLSHPALSSPVTLTSEEGAVTIEKMMVDSEGNYIECYRAICNYTLNGYTYSFVSYYQYKNVIILDGEDNSTIIADHNSNFVTAFLEGRTLWFDGSWNTLCLPFDLNEEQVTEYLDPDAGMVTLSSSDYDSATGTLTLNFEEATTIEAGKPYLLRWGYIEGEDIEFPDPGFEGVIIDNTLRPVKTKYVDFVGSFSPVTLTSGDKSVLYLGANNTLYYPSTDMTVGSCRAVFRLKDIEAGDLPTQARAFVLNFGEDEATGVREVKEVREVKDNSWYTLDGRRLSGKPTQHVIYINNSNKVVIK
jgi:hypothetical protein